MSTDSLQQPSGAIDFFSQIAPEFGELYENSPAFRERLSVWFPLLDKYGDGAGTWADVGCGTGVFTVHLATRGGNGMAIDPSAPMLEECRTECDRRGVSNVAFAQAALPDLRLVGPSGFDLVIASSVLEYVPELDRALERLCALVKPGGWLIVSMPNVWSISRGYQRLKHRAVGKPEIYDHIRHFASPRALARRVRKQGMRLEESAHYDRSGRVARVGKRLLLPPGIVDELFVAVFQKASA